MVILAMLDHGQDARATPDVPWPSWPCRITGRMPVPLLLSSPVPWFCLPERRAPRTPPALVYLAPLPGGEETPHPASSLSHLLPWGEGKAAAVAAVSDRRTWRSHRAPRQRRSEIDATAELARPSPRCSPSFRGEGGPRLTFSPVGAGQVRGYCLYWIFEPHARRTTSDFGLSFTTP
jgi:hypothetical protein